MKLIVLGAILVLISTSLVDAEQVAAPFPRPIAISLAYPEFSRRVEQEGDVIIAIAVDRDGKVASCSVEQSSGFPELDAESCRSAKRSWRFAKDGDPALYNVAFRRTLKWRLDPSGEQPARGSTFVNALPDPSRRVNIAEPGDLPPGRRANLGLYLKITAAGTVESCKVRWGSGNAALDRRTCEIVSKRWRYEPATKDGVAVSRLELSTFFWAAPDAPMADVDSNRPMTGSQR